MHSVPISLLKLARQLSNSANRFCIVAEGNVSMRSEGSNFWIKASGSLMESASESDFVCVDGFALLSALDDASIQHENSRPLLNSSCTGEGATPSTEAFMHALLLESPGIQVVAHTHPSKLLSVLCLEGAEIWAAKRLFPDEIVLCGSASCWVPYVRPGIDLARSIREKVGRFLSQYKRIPKTIWLENHGLIALGATCAEVFAITAMAEKAADVLLSCLQSGQSIRWLDEKSIQQIDQWPDEHARLKAIQNFRALLE